MAKKIICPFCYREAFTEPGKTCPHDNCLSNRRGIPLQGEVFTHELFPIVVVGAPSSGKTHFLTVLRHLLSSNNFWPDFWQWKAVDYRMDQSVELETEDGNPFRYWEKILYNDHQMLPSTQKDVDHPPLLLSVSFNRSLRNLFHEPYRKRDLLIAFTDTAGEHSLGGRLLKFEENYAAATVARGIVVFLDVGELGNPHLAGTVVSDLRRGRRSSVPLALCMSKLDMLKDYFETFHDTDKSVEGKAMLCDIGNNSDAVQHLIGGTELVNNVTGSFKYTSFFAVSALGMEPFESPGILKKEMEKDWQPRCVLDPLLWLLWQHGYIGGVEVREDKTKRGGRR